MKSLRSGLSRVFPILALLLAFAGPSSSEAQKVPIDFNDFHGYTGTVEYLKNVADAYPDITELIEIGKSTLGERPIYVLVISDMSNGTTIDQHVPLRNMRKENVQNVSPMKSYHGKPGHLISASTHGNEFTGTEVCLYTIDKLVTGYGSDPEITRLVEHVAFYILPIVNPDGVYSSVEGDISQRANSMAVDNDGDGRVNEDGPEDLNGDGHITQFRYQDPEGGYVVDDVDPRLMIRLGRDETTSKQRYSVITEDMDNDGDGERGEDGEGGIDLNRNYPEGWWLDEKTGGGSGHYPLSAVETRAEAEFLTNNPNILVAQTYHTSGGFTYRAMGTQPHTSLDPKDVAIFDRVMGKRYLELIGEEVPEAWTVSGPLDEYKAQLRETSDNQYAIMRGYELPRGWRVSYSEAQDRRYSFGMAADWMYKQLGMFAICTELWNSQKDMRGIPAFTGEEAGTERERALLTYQDEEFDGKFFIPWERFQSSRAGRRGNRRMDPPLPGLQRLSRGDSGRGHRHPLPIRDLSGRASSGHPDRRCYCEDPVLNGRNQIVEVSAVVENQGVLATHTGQGAELAGNREDVVWLIGDRDKIRFLQGSAYQKIGVLGGAEPIPGYEREFRADGPDGNRREVKWLVAIDGDSPLKVVVSSQKGGTKVRELRIGQ